MRNTFQVRFSNTKHIQVADEEKNKKNTRNMIIRLSFVNMFFAFADTIKNGFCSLLLASPKRSNLTLKKKRRNYQTLRDARNRHIFCNLYQRRLKFITSVGRQMCYNCQYTITSTKQGIECASQFNETITIGKCPNKCIIHSETNLETGELRSYFRGCGKGYPKNVCIKNGNIETCYYTCTHHFCNDIDIRPPQNHSSCFTIDQTLLALIVFTFVRKVDIN